MRWTPSLPPLMITGHSILEAVYFSYKKTHRVGQKAVHFSTLSKFVPFCSLWNRSLLKITVGAISLSFLPCPFLFLCLRLFSPILSLFPFSLFLFAFPILPSLSHRLCKSSYAAWGTCDLSFRRNDVCFWLFPLFLPSNACRAGPHRPHWFGAYT